MPHPRMAHIVESYRAKYGKDPADVAFAPGRVNIIGEHTDYNEGFVLPCAVDLATFVAFSPRSDGRARVYSDMVGEQVEFELSPLEREGLPFWARYAWGTAMSLLERGLPVKGIDAYASSTVPQGGGLSSSASFEIAMALAYLGDAAADVPPLDLVHLCRRAENAFVGVNCGVMDQFSSIFGAEGRAILLDCRTLEYRLVPVGEHISLVVADTKVRHALGDTGYHRRQEECREAVAVLSASEGVTSLRDATLEMLERNRAALGDAVFRRARHVVTENARVIEAAEAMAAHDSARLGVLMEESHASLRDDYEVSCDELNAMAEGACGIAGHFGTRMVGGGFGGCTVSAVERDSAREFAAELLRRYRDRTAIDAVTHIVLPGRGAGLLGLAAGAGHA